MPVLTVMRYLRSNIKNGTTRYHVESRVRKTAMCGIVFQCEVVYKGHLEPDDELCVVCRRHVKP